MRREVWGDDADIVRPERWDQLTPEQSSPFAYSPFSNGPRICIGKQFAYLEIKAFLFELIRTYRFLSIEGPFTVETPSLVLRPNGLKIKIGKI